MAKAVYGHDRPYRSLRCDRIDAPFVIDAHDGESAYVEQVSSTLEEGDIVVLDDLGSHRRRQVLFHDPRCWRARILPPYSPDLSDRAGFAKLKHRMRDAAERTVETLAPRRAPQTFRQTSAQIPQNSGYAAI